MNEKIDALVGRLEALAEKWLDEFEAHPLRTLVRLLVIVTILKWVKQVFYALAPTRR